MSNPNYTNILTSTIESRNRVLKDNVTKNNALLMRLKKKGKIRTFSGGHKILEEVEYAENTNSLWYSGYDTIAAADWEFMSAPEFTIKEAAVPLIISGLQRAQNSGKERMLDLLEAKVKNTEKSLMNLIAVGVHSDGTGTSGKQINGLQAYITTAPSSGTVAGINRATATWWRNIAAQASVTYGAASTSATILNHIARTKIQVVRGMDSPDLCLVDNTAWVLVGDAMRDRLVVVDKEMGESGFNTMRVEGMDVVADGGIGGAIPANYCYILNTDYLHFRPHADYNMVALGDGDREPVNQDAMIRFLGFKGNLTISGAQFQALLRVN